MTNNVSIVIPTFNRADYLKQCIESALSQTYPCEIIVCDHGSSDQTPTVALSYGSAITYVRREIDSGVHFCWLDGILHASSDFIHLNYDDDWIEPLFVEKCMKLFTDDVGFVYSNARAFYEKENKYSEAQFTYFDKTGVYPSSHLVKFAMRSLISPGAIILRKQIILDNLFCGKLPFSKYEYRGVGPDLLFSLMSTIKYKKIGFVNECLAVFRSHVNSITVDASSDALKTLKIDRAYKEARKYYLTVDFIRKYRLNDYLYLYYRIKNKLRLI
ncbi:MAG: glycosyltransferase family 2 protein [Parachlamydiaceae bacterium]|nr:glycosyltransferase family 2 protein [Parachlamydiaceae bacterium]